MRRSPGHWLLWLLQKILIQLGRGVHPYKGPNFDRCHTKLKIELESCRRRFRTFSGAFWIGAQKKLIFFSGTSMAHSIVEQLSAEKWKDTKGQERQVYYMSLIYTRLIYKVHVLNVDETLNCSQIVDLKISSQKMELFKTLQAHSF